jgi:hypothetical protein
MMVESTDEDPMLLGGGGGGEEEAVVRTTESLDIVVAKGADVDSSDSSAAAEEVDEVEDPCIPAAVSTSHLVAVGECVWEGGGVVVRVSSMNVCTTAKILFVRQIIGQKE